MNIETVMVLKEKCINKLSRNLVILSIILSDTYCFETVNNLR